MILRGFSAELQRRLDDTQAAILIGSRQVGKTTTRIWRGRRTERPLLGVPVGTGPGGGERPELYVFGVPLGTVKLLPSGEARMRAK